jgi:hypothetical protein
MSRIIGTYFSERALDNRSQTPRSRNPPGSGHFMIGATCSVTIRRTLKWTNEWVGSIDHIEAAVGVSVVIGNFR